MKMLYNPFDLLPIYNVCEKPPTLYSLLESIVNYGKDDKTKIKDLAKEGRSTIFDFEYPLTSNINKENFECMILNHFIMRRIGFQTPTAFKIQLNVKLNEIMPMYNKMFDMIEGWDIFKDGENITRNVSDTRNKQNTIETEKNSSSSDNKQSTTTDRDTTQSTKTDEITETNNIEGSSTSQNSLNNSSTTTSQSIQDKRHSDTPQNEISDVQNGTYVSDYSYNTENNTASDSSQSTGSSSSSNESEETKEKNTTTTENETKNGSTTIAESKTNTEGSTINTVESGTDRGTITETIAKSPADKMRLYKEFIENRQSIYSLIFKELECLFLQII